MLLLLPLLLLPFVVAIPVGTTPIPVVVRRALPLEMSTHSPSDLARPRGPLRRCGTPRTQARDRAGPRAQGRVRPSRLRRGGRQRRFVSFHDRPTWLISQTSDVLWLCERARCKGLSADRKSRRDLVPDSQSLAKVQRDWILPGRTATPGCGRALRRREWRQVRFPRRPFAVPNFEPLQRQESHHRRLAAVSPISLTLRSGLTTQQHGNF